jgi:hypothetical protein
MPLDPGRVGELFDAALDFEGMKQRADKIPPAARRRLAEALDRLIELAEATGKPDDVKKWKDEKARLGAAPGSRPEKNRNE